MEITIRVSDRDVNRIIQLGSKSWIKFSPEEKKEYDRLLRLLGTAATEKIFNR